MGFKYIKYIYRESLKKNEIFIRNSVLLGIFKFVYMQSIDQSKFTFTYHKLIYLEKKPGSAAICRSLIHVLIYHAAYTKHLNSRIYNFYILKKGI